MNAMRSAIVVMLVTAAALSGVRAAPAVPVVSLKDAPANTWVRIAWSATGWRDQPIFVYAAGIRRFVMASGHQAYGGVVPRHYDTEEFDLAAGRWVNAYPPAVASGRPVSGPVGLKYSKSRVMHGNHGDEGIFYKDGDCLRIGAGGQWLESRCYHEWCCAGEEGKVYAYLHDRTVRYDPAARTWEDLNARPRTGCRIWGAMCYDPVNREIVHAGGDGGSAEVGTWVYSIDRKQWRKLAFGDAEAKARLGRARALCRQGKALLGAVCNRFALTETDEEARADPKAKAEELAATITRFVETQCQGAEAEKAAGRLRAAVATVGRVGPQLAGPITPEVIAQVRGMRVLLEQAADFLSIEPPGRARSQIAYDGEHRKIVLFGGDALDRTLSDTWLYDCRTRTWQQKFPSVCPRPRAGHVLAWLPKAKKIVLAGGYSRDWLAQEVWAYDVAANEWKLLLHVPLRPEDYGRRKFSPNCPRVTSRGIQVGAVNADDVLVCLSTEKGGLTTWACKLDPARPIEIAAAQAAVSGEYTFNGIDPADWEKAARPRAAATRKFYDELPANQWTALRLPRHAPGATNRWGTTAYDVDRHQFLFWGGGHATSKENDVAHFSVRGNCWTIGYSPDDPIERVYASQPTPISFHDRPHVPVHAYKAYCYDPSAHRMFYFDRAYDPAVREWEPNVRPGLEHRGVMHSQMEPTPAGAVTYSARGLFRYDATPGRWVKLPWKGPRPDGIWCDGHSLLYDPKRDCLWLATDKDIYRYDLAKGKAARTTPAKPKALGKYLLWGEQVYLPEADLVLLMRLFQKPDGTLANAAWSPDDGTFHWVGLKFVEEGKPVRFKAPPLSWSDAMRYDPKLRLVLLNNASARRVWVLKFDRKTAEMSEIRD